MRAARPSDKKQRHMQMRKAALFLGLAVAFNLPGSAFATDISEISVNDYYGAVYFEQALEDPRVSKLKSRKQQIAKVARNMGWAPKKLVAAITKVESLEGSPKELAEKALRGGFDDSRVKGQVIDILMNDDEPKHVVLYIKWQASKYRDVVKEAATIAHVVAKKAPFVSTLSLAAIHPKAKTESKTAVWSAKIGQKAMDRIDESKINDYADRLYKRLFEGVSEQPF